MRVALLSLLFLTMVSSATSAQNSVGSIEGSVRDRSDKPIAQATVYGYTIDEMRRRVTTVTDSSGKFVFREVPPGTYQIHAYKESEGYADNFFSFFANGNKKAWRTVRTKAAGVGLTYCGAFNVSQRVLIGVIALIEAIPRCERR